MSGHDGDQLNRRDMFKKVGMVTATFLAVPQHPAQALSTFPDDKEYVKEQQTIVGKLDVNNAPVADYMQYPGMYPTIAGKIANNGPYASFKDVLKLELLTVSEKTKVKQYAHHFTATSATGLDTMRGRDPYRRTFNR